MQTVVRLGIALLAFAVGVAIGTITTFAHATAAPWMLLAGLAVVLAFVLGVRLGVGQPLATAAAVAGVVGSALLVALVPGDVVLVASDALGIAWLVGVTVLPLGGALWPLRERPGNAPESS